MIPAAAPPEHLRRLQRHATAQRRACAALLADLDVRARVAMHASHTATVAGAPLSLSWPRSGVRRVSVT